MGVWRKEESFSDYTVLYVSGLFFSAPLSNKFGYCASIVLAFH